ncbi:MAG: ATP synthase subunit I [Clostridium sp.]|nr:ATP synthase subunit I [Clostridium sp.]
MNDESKGIIKIVGMYDLIITILVTLVLFVFVKVKVLYFALGIMFSFINFIINAFTTGKTASKNCRFKVFLILLSYAIRIGLVCGTGVVIINSNRLSFFIFIAGYTAQIIAIVLYGLRLKKLEGM